MGIEFNSNDPLYLRKVEQQKEEAKKQETLEENAKQENTSTLQTFNVDPDLVMRHLAASAAVQAPTGENYPTEPDKMSPPEEQKLPEEPKRPEEHKLPEDTKVTLDDKAGADIKPPYTKLPSVEQLLAASPMTKGSSADVEYNDQGLPIRITGTDENGNKYVIIYNYDENGEVVSSRYEQYDKDSDYPNFPEVAYNYDKDGELVSIEKKSGHWWGSGDSGPVISTYDLEGREIKEVYYCEDGTVDLEKDYTYDENGKKISTLRTLYYAGSVMYSEKYDYTYGENGRVISELYTHYSPAGSVMYSWKSDYTYDENGREISNLRTYYKADGSVDYSTKSDCAYDENGRVISELYTLYKADGSVDFSTKDDYTYDENGREISRLDTHYKADGSVDESTKSDYTYDENGKMISELHTRYKADGSVNYSWKYDYTYDENGREISRLDTHYEADGSVRSIYKTDKITGELVRVEYEYDEKGNVENTKEYVYDSEYNLTGSFWKSYDDNGKLLVSAEYDKDGNKLAKSQYHYDIKGNLLSKTVIEYDADGKVVSTKAYSASEITEDTKLVPPEKIEIPKLPEPVVPPTPEEPIAPPTPEEPVEPEEPALPDYIATYGPDGKVATEQYSEYDEKGTLKKTIVKDHTSGREMVIEYERVNGGIGATEKIYENGKFIGSIEKQYDVHGLLRFATEFDANGAQVAFSQYMYYGGNLVAKGVRIGKAPAKVYREGDIQESTVFNPKAKMEIPTLISETVVEPTKEELIADEASELKANSSITLDKAKISGYTDGSTNELYAEKKMTKGRKMGAQAKAVADDYIDNNLKALLKAAFLEKFAPLLRKMGISNNEILANFESFYTLSKDTILKRVNNMESGLVSYGNTGFLKNKGWVRVDVRKLADALLAEFNRHTKFFASQVSSNANKAAGR